MKKLVLKLANIFGYHISKLEELKEDLTFYEKYSKKALDEKRFYNIGAGKFKHTCWTNVDFETDHYKDCQQNPFLHYDLMKLEPLPIESNVAELVYTSHTIEHVSDEAVINLLKESFRILKPGGGIRLTTPNAWLEFQAYKRNDISYWYWKDLKDTRTVLGKKVPMCKTPIKNATIHQLFLHHIASQLSEIGNDDSNIKYSDIEVKEYFETKNEVDSLDFFTKKCKFNPNFPGHHMNWWSKEKLILFLKEAGFSSPYQSGWGQSLFPPLRDTKFFDNTHPKISLYIEAIK